MTSIKRVLLLAVILILAGSFSAPINKNYIPDEQTAIKIAEAVWLPIYGKEIYSKQPFVAKLSGDSVWHVCGTLPPSSISVDKSGDTTFTVVHGGVPHIFMNKSDGKILDVYHTK